jgi:hypothetical protein
VNKNSPNKNQVQFISLKKCVKGLNLTNLPKSSFSGQTEGPFKLNLILSQNRVLNTKKKNFLFNLFFLIFLLTT